VDEDGTGRRIFELDGFSRSDRVPESLAKTFIEFERVRGRCERPRGLDGGTSPKMKNFMNAPIKSTTESWPSRNPCVNDRLGQESALAVGLSVRQQEEPTTTAGASHLRREGRRVSPAAEERNRGPVETNFEDLTFPSDGDGSHIILPMEQNRTEEPRRTKTRIWPWCWMLNSRHSASLLAVKKGALDPKVRSVWRRFYATPKVNINHQHSSFLLAIPLLLDTSLKQQRLLGALSAFEMGGFLRRPLRPRCVFRCFPSISASFADLLRSYSWPTHDGS
jgi:hypothetical protein